MEKSNNQSILQNKEKESGKVVNESEILVKEEIPKKKNLILLRMMY